MSASDTAGADEVRILNSISDAKSASRGSAPGAKGRGGRTAAIVAALLLILAAGAGVAFYASSPASEPALASTHDKPVAQLASADTAPAPTPAAAPADAGKPAAQPDAAVINDANPPPAAALEPAAQDAAAPQRSHDQLTNALEEGVKPPPATLKNALEAKPEKPAKHQAAHEDKKKKAAKADPKNDSDVDLIKALVARSAEVDKKRAAREANAGSSSQKLAQNQAKAPSSRNVDVVERSAGESTESLLQRCRALGFMEGEFCRWRICSGRWDTDPACKVSNSN